ncbi:chemotaxis response regulator protein-glutamate methylesterase [Methyloraptor flagellatus]|jgi:two-component system chemotaxis response regulator CheB|uniref:Protein-glutamate methylesterase/protein-glutamine glutaminase n=1 Tax=Methyloraptor flagellatus TaxID=3162530 RepID=A0AAU7XA12_9HYPH
MNKPIGVLVVDDSALVRRIMTAALTSDPEIGWVETASDPLIARDKIKKLNPDVLTLDIEMPRMNGLDFLDRIMTLRPMPVIMLSALTQHGAEAAFRALDRGAVDFIAKPVEDLADSFPGLREEILAKVKTAARIKVVRREPRPDRRRLDPIPRSIMPTDRIIAIGASTGGVEALGTLLGALPPDMPPIVVTQHMPAQFTRKFAERLDGFCAVRVLEAEDGARLLAGHAYIAPGGRHLEIKRSGSDYRCRISEGETVSGHCPSVDVLFASVARVAGAAATGVILTGMGRDGASGLLAMRRAGARTIGQDPETSLVYGMPRVAFEVGAVERQARLDAIPEILVETCGTCAEAGARL